MSEDSEDLCEPNTRFPDWCLAPVKGAAVDLAGRLTSIYRNLNEWSGGRLAVVKLAVDNFSKVRGAQAAASMSYYALFSLFPLLAVLLGLASFLLDDQLAKQRVTELVKTVIPVSQSLIEENLVRVIDLRGTAGLIGLITFTWSASSVFTVLATNINLAWPDAEPLNFFEKRTLAIGIIAVFAGLLLVSVAGTTITNLLTQLGVEVFGAGIVLTAALRSLASVIFPWIVSLLLFTGLYRWVPNTQVSWRAAFWGAIVSSTAWGAVTSVFAWYLGSGLSRYELVYGSLGAVIALLSVVYICSWIVLFSAHLSYAVQHVSGQERGDAVSG